MKTSELTGAQLDYWVARAEGYAASLQGGHLRISRRGGLDLAELGYSPSTEWAHGGPIIERERIAIIPNEGCAEWFAGWPPGRLWIGPTPLIAAMRAFVVSRYGEGVPI